MYKAVSSEAALFQSDPFITFIFSTGGIILKPYIIKRILSAIPLLLIISFVCFVFINLIPSDPAEVALRVRQVPIITEDAIAEVRSQLGLDKPYLVRYFTWVLDCLHGDFGISYVNPSRTVAGELLRCMPATLQLAGASLIMVILLSLPIGFLCAIYKDGWFDRIMRSLVFMTTAMPPYWVGLLLMWLISIKLDLFLHNKTAVGTITIVLIVAFMGLFAPFIAPHDPYATNILNKFAHFSKEYPLGTDNLGRCILSRMIYGIRPTLGLAVLTMLGTIGLGALMGLLAGYFRGITEELIMRIVDVMLSFPSQIMVFAVVALLGINVQNVILANVFIKWAWYARMIRTGVMQYRDRNFVQFSRCVGTPERFILFRHLVPSIAADLAVLSSLDVGWAIINISTLSFLGLGVQAPTPEWGAMLSEAKNVLTSNPAQMLVPGIAIVILVSAFNLMGDAIRDVLDPKEVL